VASKELFRKVVPSMDKLACYSTLIYVQLMLRKKEPRGRFDKMVGELRASLLV